MEQTIVLAAAFAIYAVIVGAISITLYVFRALGLYTLAKNININNAWLAWIPVGDAYIMGALARQSPFVSRKFPKIHITLPILYGVYFLLCSLPSVIMLTSRFMFAPSRLGLFAFGFWGLFALVFIFMLAIIAALTFVHYHIYKVYDPQNAVLYTILSALGFSFIFLFVIRNRRPAEQAEENEAA